MLSAQARTLVSKSAIVELQGLLNNFVAAEEDIDFCFIVSGGRPYLHTFESGFPTDFPVIEAELSEGTSSTPVQLDDQEYTVLSTLMGFGSSSIHLGVKRKLVTPGLLDYSLLPFLIPLAVIALAVLMLVFSQWEVGKRVWYQEITHEHQGR